MKVAIKNEKGQVIGYKMEEASGSTYVRPDGKVVARVRNETTLDKKGSVKGKGDQGLRLF